MLIAIIYIQLIHTLPVLATHLLSSKTPMNRNRRKQSPTPVYSHRFESQFIVLQKIEIIRMNE